jgi:hypothetical protein
MARDHGIGSLNVHFALLGGGSVLFIPGHDGWMLLVWLEGLVGRLH